MSEKSSTNPFFSLVIPFYNRFNLVKETLNSVFEQSFRSYEIIVVDDGSTDGSGEMLDEFYGENGNIKIIHQANLERGAARNRGFLESRGEYVIFLDSDDRLLVDHLETLYQKIAVLGNPDFVATKFEFLFNGSRKSSGIGALDEGYYNYKLFLNGNPFGCNVCVRRNNAGLKLFEEDRRLSIKEDWLFFLSNLRNSQLYLIDKVTLIMLDHEERSMRGNNEILISKTEMARVWIISYVELSKAEVKILDAHINYFCAIHAYLDGSRRRSLQFIINAFLKGGPKIKYFVLFGKTVIGRKMINRFVHGI